MRALPFRHRAEMELWAMLTPIASHSLTVAIRWRA